MISITLHAERATAALHGSLEISSVVQDRELLAAELVRGFRRFELSGLELVDTAGVQLLWWLRRAERVKGVELELVGAPPAIRAVFGAIGLDGLVSP
jgi:ABC-type transporter Mla MlaB component